MAFQQIFSTFKAFLALQLSDHAEPIQEAFSLCKDGFNYLDIGASYGIKPRWKQVEKFINFIGVEPDKRTQDSILSASNYRSSKFFPVFAWDSDVTIKFHLNRKPGVSSVYPANMNFLSRFPGPERFEPTEILDVTGSSLDDHMNDISLDFVKLDIQGGELQALKGMSGALDKALGLDVEIEFSELYKNQPLYGDVNKFLVDRGFEFVDFINLARWERKDHNSYGQLLFGDGLWLKSPESIFVDGTPEDRIYSYFAICAIHGRLDLIEKGIELGYPINYDYRPLWLKLKRNQVRARKVFNQFKDFYANVDPYCKPHLIY